ncbi:Uu.00g109790.m01.CDS01 [Anthostomella pinea]|uniref:Uu.00g109790.m01.CDS01 n=1 Tax=Anthostomella pinea TaxID=933095 RepID=A0AAI8YG80_9PEZI|nr:Uu.00g109790.m01.CDS01 [Anthostomella pinea]
MNRYKPGQPSRFAQEASARLATQKKLRKPGRLSSDHDHQGGVRLSATSNQGSDAPATANNTFSAINATKLGNAQNLGSNNPYAALANSPTATNASIDEDAKPASPPPRVPSKLNATSAPFVPVNGATTMNPTASPYGSHARVCTPEMEANEANNIAHLMMLYEQKRVAGDARVQGQNGAAPSQASNNDNASAGNNPTYDPYVPIAGNHSNGNSFMHAGGSQGYGWNATSQQPQSVTGQNTGYTQGYQQSAQAPSATVPQGLQNAGAQQSSNGMYQTTAFGNAFSSNNQHKANSHSRHLKRDRILSASDWRQNASQGQNEMRFEESGNAQAPNVTHQVHTGFGNINGGYGLGKLQQQMPSTGSYGSLPSAAPEMNQNGQQYGAANNDQVSNVQGHQGSYNMGDALRADLARLATNNPGYQPTFSNQGHHAGTINTGAAQGAAQNQAFNAQDHQAPTYNTQEYQPGAANVGATQGSNQAQGTNAQMHQAGAPANNVYGGDVTAAHGTVKQSNVQGRRYTNATNTSVDSMNSGTTQGNPAANGVQHMAQTVHTGQPQQAPANEQKVPEGYVTGLTNSISDSSILLYNDQSALNRLLPRAGAVVPHAQEITVAKSAQTAHLRPLPFHPPPTFVQRARSDVLNALIGVDGRVTLQDLMDPKFFPWAETYSLHTPVDHGVIHIKNIPFGTRRSELVALMGRNAKVLNDSLEPVHIIMERVTSKTMDAFVEFVDPADAMNCVDKFQKTADNGRIGRIGNRPVEIELSSQVQLMKEMFPAAANGVRWHGSRPEILQGSEFSWENFKCFFSIEEMTMLTKHVESPHRSSYSEQCPERPYECMISTLRKCPWYMADYITIQQRQACYDACCKMVMTLRNSIRRDPDHDRLTPQLFNRLITSCMLCCGLSVLQKDNLSFLAEMPEEQGRHFNQPRFADLWTHMYTLGPKAGVPLDVLEYYIAMIREETNRVVDGMSIGHKRALQAKGQTTSMYWGYFFVEANYPSGPALDNMTLAEATAIEWQTIDQILRRAVEGGTPPETYIASAAQGGFVYFGDQGRCTNSFSKYRNDY